MSFFTDLFGFRLKNKEQTNKHESFVPPTNDDGAVVVEGAGAYGIQLDLDGVIHNEVQVVSQYRDMLMQPEVDSAVDDIVNAAIVVDQGKPPAEINLDGIDEAIKNTSVRINDSIKTKIEDEFKNVLALLAFDDRQAYEIFKRWYIDGRLYYHLIIDEKHKSQGIQELRYIDPRQIRKVREIIRDRDEKSGAEIITQSQEYFLYNERGWPGNPNNTAIAHTTSLKITNDCIAYCHSGLIDKRASLVLSYLHKAIKALNQLRMMEDAAVIYRIARAPERRIFYIDVGNLPKTKAEEYLRSVMTKYRNKMLYDPETGAVKDGRRHLSMLEDFWLARREGSAGTEIDTLPAGANLGEIEDINYFQKKLFRSLNVPYSRFESDTGFNMGRASEISRDELKFNKFVDRIRRKFSTLFETLLERQLLLKNILTKPDWDVAKRGIKFDFASDSYFSESKENEILAERIEMLEKIEQYKGRYFSESQIRKQILKQTDEEIKQIDKENEDFEPTDLIGMVPAPEPKAVAGVPAKKKPSVPEKKGKDGK